MEVNLQLLLGYIVNTLVRRSSTISIAVEEENGLRPSLLWPWPIDALGIDFLIGTRRGQQ